MMLVQGSTIFQIHIQNHFSPENCFLQIPLNCSFSKVQATFEAQLCHFFFFQLDRMLLEGSQKLLNLEERKFFKEIPRFLEKTKCIYYQDIFSQRLIKYHLNHTKTLMNGQQVCPTMHLHDF